jgi:DNA helicase-2/ATP-dependent DNA helicase PcrA
MPAIRDRLRQFAETLTEMEGFEESPDLVSLSTLHKAKGMEWDTVFIGGITSSQFQYDDDDYFMGEKFYLTPEVRNPEAAARAELDYLLHEKKAVDPDRKARQELIAERIRLLYVGITRARENLFLSAHAKKNGWDKDPAYVFIALSNFIESAAAAKASLSSEEAN